MASEYTFEIEMTEHVFLEKGHTYLLKFDADNNTLKVKEK